MNLPDRLRDARKDFQRLADLSPIDTAQQAKAFLQLGRICLKLSDLPQGRESFQAALKIDQRVNVLTEEERSEIKKVLEQSGV